MFFKYEDIIYGWRVVLLFLLLLGKTLYMHILHLYTRLFLFLLIPFTHELCLFFLLSFTSKQKIVCSYGSRVTLYHVNGRCLESFQEWQESLSFSRIEATTVDEVVDLQKPCEITIAGAFRRLCKYCVPRFLAWICVKRLLLSYSWKRGFQPSNMWEEVWKRQALHEQNTVDCGPLTMTFWRLNLGYPDCFYEMPENVLWDFSSRIEVQRALLRINIIMHCTDSVGQYSKVPFFFCFCRVNHICKHYLFSNFEVLLNIYAQYILS